MNRAHTENRNPPAWVEYEGKDSMEFPHYCPPLPSTAGEDGSWRRGHNTPPPPRLPLPKRFHKLPIDTLSSLRRDGWATSPQVSPNLVTVRQDALFKKKNLKKKCCLMINRPSQHGGDQGITNSSSTCVNQSHSCVQQTHGKKIHTEFHEQHPSAK